VPEEEIMFGMLAKEGKIAVMRVYVTSPPIFPQRKLSAEDYSEEEEKVRTDPCLNGIPDHSHQCAVEYRP